MKTLKVLLDLETSGTDIMKCQPIQIYAKVFNEEDDFEIFVKPAEGKHFSYEAYKVHGFSQDYLKQFGIPLATAIGMFEDWIRDMEEKYKIEEIQLVGHNVHFDIYMLFANGFDFDFVHHRHIDTCTYFETKKFIENDYTKETLKNITSRYQVKTNDLRPHNAKDDCLLVERLLNALSKY